MGSAKQKINRSSGRPVGIFDSGIGGLTVLKEINKLLPKEDLIYLGDTARVPYGTKSPETVNRYSLENTKFLLSKNVKAVVVACNTASATSVPELRKTFRNLPILGMIEAGVEEAMRRTSSGRIGVIGTSATIRSGRYEALLRESGAAEVISVACPLFVPLAEEGWTGNSVARDAAKLYLEPVSRKEVDTLILGCTHYPLLQTTIASVCGTGVSLVNSAYAAAVKLADILSDEKLIGGDGKGDKSFFVTDSIERALEVGGRFLGEDLSGHIQIADLSTYSPRGESTNLRTKE
ncbi:MAG: glutamate racemase [bacterium]|nr:MAG: glutamate racemase [bacterium]